MSSVIIIIIVVVFIIIPARKRSASAAADAKFKAEQNRQALNKSMSKAVGSTNQHSAGYKAVANPKPQPVKINTVAKPHPQPVEKYNKVTSSSSSKAQSSVLLEDRNNDWLANQLREEHKAFKRTKDMFNLKIEHASHCDARYVKQLHATNCDAKTVGTAQGH